MIPLQRISTKAVMPTIIVTSPGAQVRVWPRAMIQERMKGAVQAARSRNRSVPNTSQALALSLAPITGSLVSPMIEFGLSLVENQGRKREIPSTSAASMPPYSPGVSFDRSR